MTMSRKKAAYLGYEDDRYTLLLNYMIIMNRLYHYHQTGFISDAKFVELEKCFGIYGLHAELDKIRDHEYYKEATLGFDEAREALANGYIIRRVLRHSDFYHKGYYKYIKMNEQCHMIMNIANNDYDLWVAMDEFTEADKNCNYWCTEGRWK